MVVTVRELKTHLSRYLAEVRAGRPIEISSRRRVIARLTPVPDPATTGIDRLLATGAASWSGGKPQGARLELTRAAPCFPISCWSSAAERWPCCSAIPQP